MGEDHLTHRQRVRLESFAQAINSSMPVPLQKPLPADVVRVGSHRPNTMEELFARAEEIEAWLWKVEEERPRRSPPRQPTPGEGYR